MIKISELQIKESTNIMVIGGGAAGVEMAAEVAAFYPEKKVSRRFRI